MTSQVFSARFRAGFAVPLSPSDGSASIPLVTPPTEPASEPVLTPRFRLGLGLMAFGIRLMFISGKVLPSPLPAGIAAGITLAVAGFVVVVVEALRD